MLLVLTDAFDVHADYVLRKLDDKGISYFRFNLNVENLKRTYVSFTGEEWKICVDGNKYSTDQFACVWCRRPFVELSLEETNYTDVDFKIWKEEWNKTLLGIYNSIKDIPWLNPLRKAYKGENKYYQMELAKKIGFNFPDTLVTNDKKMASEFITKHKKALFKLMSQEMYDVGNNDFMGLFTNVITIDDMERFNDSEENPIVLQEYVDKKYEVRYTIVAGNHFACRIESQRSDKAKQDWRRYDIRNTPHYRMEPPEDIKNKAEEMLRILGLEYGALDFIVTPDDEWYFLEINCMGQWLWIEQLTGLQISDSIVGWVENHIK